MTLPSELITEVCAVIMNTGWMGCADDYVLRYYHKPFNELTTCEAEIIVRTLSDKKGCLANEPTYDEDI